MYSPSDDSFFFQEFLKDYFSRISFDENFSVLDMGSGSGILAETCADIISKKNIICVDVQYDCVKHLRKKGFAAIHSNLFKEVPRERRYNLILFNAPYLPQDKAEEKQSQLETTGGKRGDEISLKFLRQSKKFLKPNGKIFLLVSSLTPLEKINEYHPKIVARKKIWFEELLILEITFS